LWKRKPR